MDDGRDGDDGENGGGDEDKHDEDEDEDGDDEDEEEDDDDGGGDDDDGDVKGSLFVFKTFGCKSICVYNCLCLTASMFKSVFGYKSMRV
jgi:hypothetical protein